MSDAVARFEDAEERVIAAFDGDAEEPESVEPWWTQKPEHRPGNRALTGTDEDVGEMDGEVDQ